MFTDRIPQKLLFIIYVIMVITISIIPSSMLQFGSLWKYDKYIHFIEYLILGLLLLNCLNPKKYTKIFLVTTLLFVILFSGADEFIIQKYFGKGRLPDINDWFMDSFGASIGILMRYLLRNIIK